jgi:hypothetical protein
VGVVVAVDEEGEVDDEGEVDEEGEVLALPAPDGAPAPAEVVVGGAAAGADVTFGVGRGTDSET